MASLPLRAALIIASVAGFSQPSPARLPPSKSSAKPIKPLRSLRLSSSPSLTEGAGAEHLTEVENEYPVQILHQGHFATIYVKENEPILQALERQSTFSTKQQNPATDQDGDVESEGTALALSNIPHECRRGNCLTCSSRMVQSNSQNILANVDNGLSPTIASELTKSGYVLTCCSYVTGPGVVLELDQNDEVWDLVYRQRICNKDSKQVALEAQARLLRRVDEENVGKWKSKLEQKWGDSNEKGK
mmetsp:Transcript_12171/g.25914  ORF Transcript_12171/g.25914 Transcript_12171/m.25914 type:complete len:246 (-) Transcript_12171:233-970(-)